MDLESDRAESMRLAIQRGLTQSKPQFRFACTVCKKKFLDYANMCRHRRLAHQRHMMHLGTMKKENPESNHAHSPLRALFDPDMDRNSAFYARVSRNIADNLKYHVEGKQEEIKQGGSFIKWKSMEEELVPADNKIDKLEHYNFPQGYVMQEPNKLFQEKVQLVDYVESSGLGAIEKARAIISDLPDESPKDDEQVALETTKQSDTHVESKHSNNGVILSQPGSSGMLSPPALSRRPDLPASPPQPRPPATAVTNPPKSLTIKVPEMKLCKICHCVFHNRDVFRDHMMHKHRIVIPPPMLEPQAQAANAPLTSPPAHQHQRPLNVLPPPLMPGVNPNHARSLIVSPHLSPPPAHQGPNKQLSPAPPKLSPMLPSAIMSPTLQRPTDLEGPMLPSPPPVPTPPPSEGGGPLPDVTCIPDPQAEPTPKAANIKNVPTETKGKKETDKEDPSKQVTGDDPNPQPRKFVCLVCFNEFKDPDLLKAHQEEKHRTVQCKSVAVDLSFTTTWLTQPSPVGMLNITSSRLPSKTGQLKWTFKSEKWSYFMVAI